MLIAEITVAKKTRNGEIQKLKDDCHTRMGGSCKETDRLELCKLCRIDPDAAKLRAHFERRFETALESSKSIKYESPNSMLTFRFREKT